ncbi:uncharacterized protein RAG0_12665 [Rhynchosporium agropyri]|uniref:Uncharacterized protein n=1 Tax=Rhynchosporium agropyri TaxID=914238 RepID=A0A1E1L939_9HELO|nr:uncharacterized protein RAG0_12665 [Rhynchosporium agropyri]
MFPTGFANFRGGRMPRDAGRFPRCSNLNVSSCYKVASMKSDAVIQSKESNALTHGYTPTCPCMDGNANTVSIFHPCLYTCHWGIDTPPAMIPLLGNDTEQYILLPEIVIINYPVETSTS